jgi:hypothetical protein
MSRWKIDDLDRQFAELHNARSHLARTADPQNLFEPLGDESVLWPVSAATSLVRSAAFVEQLINGITVRLWDDPFEWTLPERMLTPDDLIAYFVEVETARLRGFEFLKDDDDLDRSIPAPIEIMPLARIFTETIERSRQLLNEANSILLNKPGA